MFAVFITHFWPGTGACLLPLAWDMPCCGFVARTWGQTFSACGWTSSFSTVYAGTISLAICNVTASFKAVHRDPFFSYGTQWLNDYADVGSFIADVCGLLRSCTSCSEQQVSHCDACVCLRGWNKFVGSLPLVTTAFKQTLQQAVVCSRSDATKPSY